jgi:tetratricopeptide (TPR) repeat protein
MKDPLQKEINPYEILGVHPEASAGDIDRAFGVAVGRNPRQVQQLTRARQILKQQPVERALIDLFLYDSEVLLKLEPSPALDTTILEIPQRAATAKAWEGQLRKSFPHLAQIHSLAILWYWWAVHEEAQWALSEPPPENPRGPYSVTELWRRAIAYWVMLVATPGFWNARPQVPGDAVEEIQRKIIEERLRRRLQDGVKQHKDQPKLAEAYHTLELALSTELKTAQDLALTGIKTRSGAVCCGPIMLTLHGQLTKFRQKIEAALEKTPGDERLRALRDALSPYTQIGVLLEKNRPEQALKAIESLPDEEQSKAEVVHLRLRAWYAQGQALAEQERFAEALETWGQALHLARERNLPVPDGLEAQLAETCHKAALHLQQRDQEGAIALLEKGQALVEDPKIRETLGTLLSKRGVETFNEGQKELVQNRQNPEALRKLKRGLADLEQAARLGNAEAAKQAETARTQMAQVVDYDSLPPEVARLIRKAEEAEAKEDWDSAVTYLRYASKIGAADPQALGPVQEKLKQAEINQLLAMANHRGKREDWALALGYFELALERIPAEQGATLNQPRSVFFTNLGIKEANRQIHRWSGGQLTSMTATEIIQEMSYAALYLKRAVELDLGNVHAQQQFQQVAEAVKQMAQAAISNGIPISTLPTDQDREKREQQWKRGAASHYRDREKKKVCPACEAIVKEEVDLCTHCGHDFRPQRLCTSCNHSIPKAVTTCPHCGYRKDWSSVALLAIVTALCSGAGILWKGVPGWQGSWAIGLSWTAVLAAFWTFFSCRPLVKSKGRASLWAWLKREGSYTIGGFAVLLVLILGPIWYFTPDRQSPIAPSARIPLPSPVSSESSAATVSASEVAQDPATVPLKEPQDTTQTEIRLLLAKARNDLENEDRYRQGISAVTVALNLQADHPEALEMLNDAIRHELNRGALALSDNDIRQARAHLTYAAGLVSRYNLDVSEVEELRTEIGRRERSAARLSRAYTALRTKHYAELDHHLAALFESDGRNAEVHHLAQELVNGYLDQARLAGKLANKREAERWLGDAAEAAQRFGVDSSQIARIREQLATVHSASMDDLKAYHGKFVAVTLKDGRIRKGRLATIEDDLITLTRRITSMGMKVKTKTDIYRADIASIEITVSK